MQNIIMTQAKIFAVLVVAYFATVVSARDFISDFENMTVTEMCSFLAVGTIFLRPNTCNTWIKCATDSGDHEVSACAEGLSYDKEQGVCTYAENVDCPYLISPNSTNVCINENNGVFFADPESCNGYIFCKAHTVIRGTCPNGLVFNPKTRACAYKNEYTCPEYTKVLKSGPCRSLPNNTRIANEVECIKYHVCVDGNLKNRECESNMAYDYIEGRCVNQHSAVCFARASLPEPESTFCLDENGHPRTGYFRDEENCSKYFVCARTSNGKHDTEPKHLECKTGQYFDAEKFSCRDRLHVKCSLDRCAGTDLTYVNVAGDCSKYARCLNGVTVSTGSCPLTHNFDERSQGCTSQKTNFIACAA